MTAWLTLLSLRPMNRKCIPVIPIILAFSLWNILAPDMDSLEYSYRTMRADARSDLFPTEEANVNVLKTMSYEDPAFGSIPPYKFFDLSFIQEVKSESR